MTGQQQDGTASQSEAAEFLGVTTRTLRRWEIDGDGPPRLPKGRARYPWVQLREWSAGPAGQAHGVSTDAPG
jgi:transcriptional regulator with XRE-family HTH domain